MNIRAQVGYDTLIDAIMDVYTATNRLERRLALGTMMAVILADADNPTILQLQSVLRAKMNKEDLAAGDSTQ
jgi:hypothetical protein